MSSLTSRRAPLLPSRTGAFPDPRAFLAPDGPFERAAARADTVAERWLEALSAEDRHQLIAGFHFAETMAGFAIAHARTQVPDRYREGLEAQARDEARHIAVFAGWLPDEVRIVEPQQRQTTQWLTLLLVNELAGFCQFRMLARMLESDVARAAIDDIAADERVHVARLLGWLEPLWTAREAGPVGQFIQRFRRDLPGRMCQFFPRAELEPLRAEMAAVIDSVLEPLPGG